MASLAIDDPAALFIEIISLQKAPPRSAYSGRFAYACLQPDPTSQSKRRGAGVLLVRSVMDCF